MKERVLINRRLAVLLLVSVALPGGACVKLPRHTSLTHGQSASQPPAQESGARAPRVNINTASPAELEKLPGIGKALAARIVAFRQQQGRFRRAEHLIMVRGISDRRFRALRELITVE
jgi:competence protein ComEA